ncbi:SPOR domain-containing protein [Sphingomonas sp. Mn802worker]|uniref:SPOR domain-containing protein n=1 Tax=Sphingomonas sp. Mn802worker TaxID=629773 RepID=UPI0003632CE4|nr:SPOR domain-containing protein [Sphingomonas sp. Mn802worker]
MRSHASVLLLAPLLVAAQQPDASVTGPRGTAGNGEAGVYDRVGRAETRPGEAFTAAHARLPLGSVAEVTDLGTGHIILVQITTRPTDTSAVEITLSSAAARALGLAGDRGTVRVRSVQPSSSDLAALRSGSSAAPRLPAPDALLRALRREVAAPAVAAAPQATATSALTRPVVGKPKRKAPTSAAQTKPTSNAALTRATVLSSNTRAAGPLVQVAALRDEARARAVARTLDGHVEQATGWWRVRLGPFADRAAAQRARDAAVSRGYGGASIIQAP